MHRALLRPVLDVTSLVGQQPHDVDEQPARDDRGPLALHLRLERVRSESSMSVAASSRLPSSARSSIPERICTVPRVDTARETTPSLRGELVPRARDLHPRP